MPSPVPRRTGAIERRKSSPVGHKRLSFSILRPLPPVSSILVAISAIPKRPIETAVKPSPSESSRMPKVKRSVPVLTSMPTRLRRRPIKAIAMDLAIDPPESRTEDTRPRVRKGDVLLGTEEQGDLHERRTCDRNDNGHDTSREKRCERGDGEAAPARPCSAIL